MNDKRYSIRPLDGIILGIILFVIIIAGIFVYGTKTETLLLHIEAPSGTWVYQLSSNRELSIQGSKGITTIKITDGKAFVVESVCPNKNCITAKALRQAGDWTACLPNRVFLHIEGNTPKDQAYTP